MNPNEFGLRSESQDPPVLGVKNGLAMKFNKATPSCMSNDYCFSSRRSLDMNGYECRNIAFCANASVCERLSIRG